MITTKHSFAKFVAIAALGCWIGLASDCTSSKLSKTWHDTNYEAPPLTKVLVVSVRKHKVQRRIWEDAFVNELAKHGVSAIPSYRLFNAGPPDTDQVLLAVKKDGYDGILAILKMTTEKKPRYNQGYTTIEQNELKGSYWQRYRTYYSEIEHPAYIDSQKVDIRAIDVTATSKSGQLIWSTKSRTPDPDSVIDVQHVIAELVISELARRDVIGPRK